MTGRWNILVLMLCIGASSMGFVGGAVAQIPAARPPGIRPDDPRIVALRNRLRSGAFSVKPEDIGKLIQPKSPMMPPKPPPQKEPTTGSNPKPTNQIGKVVSHVTAPPAKDQKQAPPAPAPAQANAKNPRPAGRVQQIHGLITPNLVPALPTGFHPVVRVQAPGRLDWTFVVSRQSLDPAPALQMAGYSSTAQTYELYIPPLRKPARSLGLILHVSCAQQSDGWIYFQKICEKYGFALAGVHGAGNAIPDPWRARIVLDVLDDVRHRLPIDPDRTYITGGSGAGHEAGSIAHALPELFGGVMGICGAWNLRVEQMLRQRMRERFSEAVVTGGADFNRGELEFEFSPILRIQNIRTRLWLYPDMGHAVPNAARLEQVFLWLEAGLPQRRAAGALFPAGRLTHDLNPQEWSIAVLLEACQRIEMPGGLLSGLFELQAVVDRWRGLPAAEVAQSLLHEFDATSAVPWREINRAERLDFRYLQAKMFDGTLARPPMPGYSVPRINLVDIGISLWQEVHDLASANSSVSKEAAQRLAELHKEAGG